MKTTLARLELHHGPGFGDHGSRVAALSLATAIHLGLKRREMERLRFSAFVHDVGKTRVPPAILDKGGPLTHAESAAVREHPKIGYDQLKHVVHRDVAEAVLCHHERWDGTGYPFGIRGNEIPLHARIIYVADAFDVMTSGREYRNTLSVSQAGAELARFAGRQFDPKVVDAFASLDGSFLKAQNVPVAPEPRLYA